MFKKSDRAKIDAIMDKIIEDRIHDETIRDYNMKCVDKIVKDNMQSLVDEIKDLSDQNEELFRLLGAAHAENKKLNNMFNQLVTDTFANPKSQFETVIFQRFGEKPTIIYKGRKMDLLDAGSITVLFDSDCGGCGTFETSINVNTD